MVKLQQSDSLSIAIKRFNYYLQGFAALGVAAGSFLDDSETLRRWYLDKKWHNASNGYSLYSSQCP